MMMIMMMIIIIIIIIIIILVMIIIITKFVKYIQSLGIEIKIKHVQKLALLGTARIIRKVLSC